MLPLTSGLNYADWSLLPPELLKDIFPLLVDWQARDDKQFWTGRFKQINIETDLISAFTVCKTWWSVAKEVEGEWLKTTLTPLRLCGYRTGAISSIINHNRSTANLIGVQNLTDKQMQLLIEKRPDLKVLFVKSSDLKNFPLEKLTELESLYFDCYFFPLEKLTEALPSFTKLESLNIEGSFNGLRGDVEKEMGLLSSLAKLKLKHLSISLPVDPEVRDMDDRVPELFSSLSSLGNLKITTGDGFQSNAKVSKLLSYLPNLTMLDLSMRGFDGFPRLTQLKKLRLFGWENPLLPVFSHCSSIEELDISSSQTFLDNAFSPLKHLKKLKAPSTMVDDGIVQQLSVACPHLEVLDISSNNDIRSAKFNFPLLKSLKVAHTDLRDYALQAALSQCSQIECLDISGCREITGVSLVDKDLSKLKKLKISACDNIKVELLGLILSNASDLEELIISHWAGRDSANLAKAISKCSRLKRLDLSSHNEKHGDTLNGEELKQLLFHLPHLISLNLRRHPNSRRITVDQLIEVLADAHKLKYLNLDGWSIEEIGQISLKYPKLSIEYGHDHKLY